VLLWGNDGHYVAAWEWLDAEFHLFQSWTLVADLQVDTERLVKALIDVTTSASLLAQNQFRSINAK
jgi:hypothetical protein